MSEIMTVLPETIGPDATLSQAASVLAKHDIGAVIIVDPAADGVVGLLTDRDIVIRACAEEVNPTSTSIEGYFTPTPTVVGPNDLVQEVDFLTRDQDVRRVPVVECGRAIGIVSLGDLAARTDPASPLTAMTIARPDH
ncbi:MAG: CBS domain-containing protein [Actinomycetota bacterium]